MRFVPRPLASHRGPQEDKRRGKDYDHVEVMQKMPIVSPQVSCIWKLLGNLINIAEVVIYVAIHGCVC